MAACLSALVAVAAGASPAQGAIGLGQLAVGSPPLSNCNTLGYDIVQPTVSSGTSYVVPEAGTITSWTTNASADAGQAWSLKVFRQVTPPATYQVVGKDGPRPLTPGVVNTFSASVPVKAGDVLGINDNDGSSANTKCTFAAGGDNHLEKFGNLGIGATDSLGTDPERINVAAAMDPTNTFSIVKTQTNQRRGTATLTLDLPNPGELSVSGNGVKAASNAHEATTVPAPGPANVLVQAKGRQKGALNRTGKVKLNVTITFTPTGGSAHTQGTKVKLRKR